MNPNFLLEKLTAEKLENQQVKKYTLIINDKSEVQGALFFIPSNGKEFKVMVPAPFHQTLITENTVASYKEVLKHKESMLLK